MDGDGETYEEEPRARVCFHEPQSEEEGQAPQVFQHRDDGAVVYCFRDNGEDPHRDDGTNVVRDREQVRLKGLEAKVAKRKGEVLRRGTTRHTEDQATISPKSVAPEIRKSEKGRTLHREARDRNRRERSRAS